MDASAHYARGTSGARCRSRGSYGAGPLAEITLRHGAMELPDPVVNVGEKIPASAAGGAAEISRVPPPSPYRFGELRGVNHTKTRGLLGARLTSGHGQARAIIARALPDLIHSSLPIVWCGPIRMRECASVCSLLCRKGYLEGFVAVVVYRYPVYLRSPPLRSCSPPL